MRVYRDRDSETIPSCSRREISHPSTPPLQFRRGGTGGGEGLCVEGLWEWLHHFGPLIKCRCVIVCVWAMAGRHPLIYRELLPYSPSPALTSLGVCRGNSAGVQELIIWNQRPIGRPPARPTQIHIGLPLNELPYAVIVPEEPTQTSICTLDEFYSLFLSPGHESYAFKSNVKYKDTSDDRWSCIRSKVEMIK